MALFDFLKKSHINDVGGVPTGHSVGRKDEQDDVLDAELPQKQRARRRLIGAVILVLAAVGLLPLLLDTSPKPLNPNITIQMPNESTRAPAAVNAAPAVASATQVAAPKAVSSAAVVSAAAPVVTPAQVLDQGETIIAAPANQAAAKPSAGAASTISAAKVKEDKAKEDKAKQDKAAAASENAQYVILIGAFSSEEIAKNWRAKMKEVNVPSFVEHKKLADGDRILLRAGPFKSRSIAESAEKKLKALGLSTKLVGQ